MFADILLSLIFGALAGCGIGGGGLLVIYLTLAKDADQLSAQGINLLFFVFSAAASLAVHLKKRKIDFSLVIPVSAYGIAGAYLGSRAAAVISPVILRKLFGGMLILSAAVTAVKMFGKKRKRKDISHL